MISIEKISEIVNGAIVGDGKLNIVGPCDIEKGKKNCITYIKDNSFSNKIIKNKASAIVVNEQFDEKDFTKTFIKVKNPSYAFLKILEYFKKSKVSKKKGISNYHLEGRNSKDWKLIDTIDIIIHIFHPEKRKFYNLEKMWSELIPKERLMIWKEKITLIIF